MRGDALQSQTPEMTVGGRPPGAGGAVLAVLRAAQIAAVPRARFATDWAAIWPIRRS
jgi:hypothetical protein